MLPFGEATSASATTVPAGTGVNVGLGADAPPGSGVAACDCAGSGATDGVGEAVGVAERVGWWATTCAVAFVAAGTHPASASATVAAMPNAASRRHRAENDRAPGARVDWVRADGVPKNLLCTGAS